MSTWKTYPAVERDPEKVRGAWVYSGTRMPASALFESLRRGTTIDLFSSTSSSTIAARTHQSSQSESADRVFGRIRDRSDQQRHPRWFSIQHSAHSGERLRTYDPPPVPTGALVTTSAILSHSSVQ